MENKNSDKWIFTKKIDKNYIAVEITRDFFDSIGTQLHNNLDNISRSDVAELVKKWMDIKPGAEFAGGYGHRIVHGHSIEDIKEVYEKFGGEGVVDWFRELGIDSWSPHGLPLPYADEIGSIFGLSTSQTLKFLTWNVTDLLSGGLALSPLITGNIDSPMLNSFTRIIAYSITGNPVLLLSAGILFIVSVTSTKKHDKIICHRKEWGERSKITISIPLNKISKRTGVINRTANIINKKNRRFEMSNTFQNIMDFINYKRHGNPTIEFGEENIPYVFRIKGIGMGGFEVKAYSQNGDEVLTLAGGVPENTDIDVRKNLHNLSKDIYFNIYHMCKCKWFYERNQNHNSHNDYMTYKNNLSKHF